MWQAYSPNKYSILQWDDDYLGGTTQERVKVTQPTLVRITDASVWKLRDRVSLKRPMPVYLTHSQFLCYPALAAFDACESKRRSRPDQTGAVIQLPRIPPVRGRRALQHGYRAVAFPSLHSERRCAHSGAL